MKISSSLNFKTFQFLFKNSLYDTATPTLWLIQMWIQKEMFDQYQNSQYTIGIPSCYYQQRKFLSFLWSVYLLFLNETNMASSNYRHRFTFLSFRIIVQEFSGCSSYHICLTHKGFLVQSQAKTDMFFFQDWLLYRIQVSFWILLFLPSWKCKNVKQARPWFSSTPILVKFHVSILGTSPST